MRRQYILLKSISVMLLIGLLFMACKKSSVAPENVTQTQKRFVVYSVDSTNIGSITFSKEQNGDARIVLSLDKGALATFSAPYQAILTSSTLPTAVLQPVNESGNSETYPVISSNHNLKVSFDALMYMRDLKLLVADSKNENIAVTEIQ